MTKRSNWPWVRLLVGGCLGGLLLGVYTLTRSPRTYVSEATIVFPMGSGSAQQPMALQLLDRLPAGSSIPNNVYDDVLTSRRSLEATAERAGLPPVYNLTDRGKIDAFMKGAVTVKVDPSGTMKVSVQLPGTPRAMSFADLVHREASDKRDYSYRELTARVVNLLIESMGKLADEIELDRSKAQVVRLREQLAKERDLLDHLQEELLRSQRQIGMVEADTLMTESTRLVVQAQHDIDASKASLDQFVRTRQVLVQAQQEKLQKVDSIPISDALLGPLVSAYQQATLALRKVEEVYGPDSAQRRSATLDVANARNALVLEARRAASAMSPAIADLTAKIEALKAYQATLIANQGRFEQSVSSRASAIERISFLEQAVTRQRANVAQLETQLRVAEVDYDVQGIKWTVLDPPQPPLHKSGPSTIYKAMLGFLLGATLCGLSAFKSLFRYLMVEPDAENEPAHLLPPDKAG